MARARRAGTLVLGLSLALFAADAAAFRGASTSDSKKPASEAEVNYAKGVKAVDARDWNLAIFHLYKAVEADPDNADAHNLLGFSYRGIKDYANAFAHYEKALALDPDHKGAHEYVGEAYLEVGKLAEAEAHLRALGRLCPAGCEEREDLEEAVAKYKAGD